MSGRVDGLFDLAENAADMQRSAVISDDGAYRYTLSRKWGHEAAAATFVMLNPSTADASIDDPTIRRCIGFAKAWGMGAITVLNLYALRSTDPRELWRAADPVGSDNDAYLAAHLSIAAPGHPVVAAWGAHAKPDRVRRVLALPGAAHLQCLGVTKDGAPRHPLYLPNASTLRPWPQDAA